jgi:hypothetical protein
MPKILRSYIFATMLSEATGFLYQNILSIKEKWVEIKTACWYQEEKKVIITCWEQELQFD